MVSVIKALLYLIFIITNSVLFCSTVYVCREEGLLCGGSCGSVMVGALEAAKGLKAGQRCVGELQICI